MANPQAKLANIGPVKVKWIKIVEGNASAPGKRVYFEVDGPLHGHFDLNSANQIWVNRLVDALIADWNVHYDASAAPSITEYSFSDKVVRPPGGLSAVVASVPPHHIQVENIRFTL